MLAFQQGRKACCCQSNVLERWNHNELRLAGYVGVLENQRVVMLEILKSNNKPLIVQKNGFASALETSHRFLDQPDGRLGMNMT